MKKALIGFGVAGVLLLPSLVLAGPFILQNPFTCPLGPGKVPKNAQMWLDTQLPSVNEIYLEYHKNKDIIGANTYADCVRHAYILLYRLPWFLW